MFTRTQHILLYAVAMGIMSGLLWWNAASSLAQAPRQWVYLAPRPGAQLVSAQTTIAVREGSVLDAQRIRSAGLFEVTGSQSGRHAGRTVLADDRRTVIFEPVQPFAAGETVYVTVHEGLRTQAGEAVGGTAFHFTIDANPLPASEPPLDDLSAIGLDSFSLPAAEPVRPGGRFSGYVTLPADFPTITVTVPASNTAEGYLFVTNFTGPGLPTAAPYAMILDNQGEPVFYDKRPPNQAATDFRKHPNGQLTYYDRSTGWFRALDQTYATVGFYHAKWHYTDHHDIELLPNGHQRYLSYDPRIIDMSAIVPGGYPTATVYGLVVQELDPSRNIVFEWRSWDHIPITDTNVSLITPVIDYMHGNTVTSDFDGHILISSRHLDEITKIDRQTADVIWRWGGKSNQFTFIDDNRHFSHQHDIRLQPNGHYTLYDNGNGFVPEYSRALGYVLDQENKTATLVWEYRNSPDTFGWGMGNAQRLPNGNTLIGWGTTVPTLTEVTPDGQKAFELTMDLEHQSYRAYRFPWVGRPTWPPTLVATAAGGRTYLHVSWNGATEVEAYAIYGGSRPALAWTWAGTRSKTGFETRIDISEYLDDHCFFRIRPIDRQGQLMTASNTVLAGGAACHPIYLPWLQK